MAAGNFKRTAGGFALAALATCLSIGWGPWRWPQQASEPAAEPSFVSLAVPDEVVAGELPAARPSLVLVSVNGGDTEVLVPQRDDGGFSRQDLRRAAVVFSQQSPGKVHALAPRLLDLVYLAMRHFDATVVHVVSGYRRDRAGSRHSQGRAVDMMIEGVDNTDLAAYLRDVGFVGVGFYPKAGFVHLDVRDASYFWIDDSAPGAPNRLRPVFEDQARSADAAARARGDKPDLYVPNNRAEDRAAAKAYEFRAQLRRERAQR
jgi:uncharacterized protein YcbK (DUF882 family)